MATKRRTKVHRESRDREIYREYNGINPDHHRVPALALSERFRISRQRIYQIVDDQTKRAEKNNARLSHRSKDIEADAAKVAELLEDLLGAS